MVLAFGNLQQDFSGNVKVANGDLGDLSLYVVLKIMRLDKILYALTFTFLLSSCRKLDQVH